VRALTNGENRGDVAGAGGSPRIKYNGTKGLHDWAEKIRSRGEQRTS